MIPKIIHYCWFGGKPLPDEAKRCIKSWKKYCPDFKIIKWNEDNFDLSLYKYTKQAHENKKWAFITDVVRLYVLVNYGGIYMDTDVEVLKPLDRFLPLNAFSGFESNNYVPTGIMGCEKNFPLFKELLDRYEERSFVRSDGSLDTTTNTVEITNTCLSKGLLLNGKKQTIEGFTLFESDYFCPKSYMTGEIKLTDNSYTIHHFSGTWHTKTEDKLYGLIKRVNKKYGEKKGQLIIRILGFPYRFKINMESRGLGWTIRHYLTGGKYSKWQ